MSLGKNIQQLRKQKHMTQEELANLLNVSRQAVSKWESDYNEPDIKTLKQLSQIFEITVDELIKEDEELLAKEEQVEDKSELTEEILKTNKKSYRLLKILISIVICLVIVFVICPIASQNNQYVNNEPINRGTLNDIQKQIDVDRKKVNPLVESLFFEVQITSWEKQKMNFKGFINTYHEYEKGKLTLLYRDGTQEELEVYPNIGDAKQYILEKEIDAKDIDTIKLQIDNQEVVYDIIFFPIENYMYSFSFTPELKATSSDSFAIKLNDSWDYFGNSAYIEENFDEKFTVNNYAEGDTIAIQNVMPLKMVLKKNDKVIKEWLIQDEKQLEESFVINEKFNKNANYQLVITYQTPLKKSMENILDLEKDNFYVQYIEG